MTGVARIQPSGFPTCHTAPYIGDYFLTVPLDVRIQFVAYVRDLPDACWVLTSGCDFVPSCLPMSPLT